MPSGNDYLEAERFFDLSEEELTRKVEEWGLPGYRAAQLLEWVYGKLVSDPERMSNFSKRDRATVRRHLIFAGASITRHQISTDGTIKLLLTWPDGRNAETVMIPDGPRRTACVSSQVGCPVGCRFCASGINGLKGNLTGGQIVEQVFALNQILQAGNQRITNVVFMGIGEPLANYANVMSAVRILHGRRLGGLGARRITISTVGVPSRIRDLAEEGVAVNLALSLHAPNEELRKELIPWAEHFRLDDILEAVQYYFERTGREITLEYILLASVNDRPEHARQLVKVCRRVRANVNLIRYNEVAGLPFGRPESEEVTRFQEILRKGGVNAHVRKSRGRDIDAACGQLRRRAEAEAVQLGVTKSSAG